MGCLSFLVRISRAIFVFTTLNIVFVMPTWGSDNMRFHGALVAEPCSIRPGDEAITIMFDTIIDKYIYSRQRTIGKPFNIHLIDCDITLSNIVKVRFTGDNNLKLPGLLAVSDPYMGIGIGIETLNGDLLPLNKFSDDKILNTGNNTISLQAYVQGEPDAISQRLIKRGEFNAVATFNFQYY